MKLPLPVLQSGKIDIAVNGIPTAALVAMDNHVTVNLINEDEIKHIVRAIPRGAKHLKYLHRISAMVEKAGISLDLTDSSGSIMQLGKSAHSILGNVKIKMSRIRRIL
ncbi:MAG: hypothetical protein QXN26_07325 [Thermoplasmataceae archaeon]